MAPDFAELLVEILDFCRSLLMLQHLAADLYFLKLLLAHGKKNVLAFETAGGHEKWIGHFSVGEAKMLRGILEQAKVCRVVLHLD